MMKKPYIFVICFFLVLALLAGLTFGLPARAFSDNENRTLAQMPELTLDSLLSGDFQEQLSDYLSDQVPGRDFWIETNTFFKKLMGKTEINGVYLGSDGYCFQQFTENSYFQSRMEGIFALVQSFAQKQEIPVAVMPVVTPGVALADKLPANAPMYDAELVWQQMKDATAACQFIDLRQTLSGQESYYFHTDHHWTAQGAYAAYEAYCQNMGLQAKPASHFEITAVSTEFYGTLYSKVLDGTLQPETVYAPQNLPQVQVTKDGKDSGGIYDSTALEKKDKYTYFFGGNYGKVEITTQAGNGQRLLVIKDSFANSFVPYLLEDYEEIVMLDLRYFNGSVAEVLEQEGITQVLITYEMSNLLTDTGIAKLSK